MEEEAASENGPQTQIKLDTEVANGIKHAVRTLDESNTGKVAKSQLQAMVANVCQALKIPFVSDGLENYLPDNTDLSVSEFLDFLETQLLVKGKKLNPKELNELSWVVVGQKYEDDPHLLTKKDAFKLWLVFKKLDISGELRVDVEELCIILEKLVRGIGVQWNEQFLTDFAEDGALTFWTFIDCLERKFLIGVEKNVLREGLQELYDFILDEVTRTGFLTKKGHSMLKSLKSRWFVLKPDKLTYYVSSGYREKKGDIILNNEAIVTSIPDKGSNKCRFLVTCGLSKKDYEQTAQDQRTKQAWMTDIQTAIDCFGGQTPLKRDLIARKAKRDEDRARKAEEERKRQEQDCLLDQQRKEIDLLKKRKGEIEKLADEEKAMLDAEIKRREELEEIQRNLQQLLEDQKRAREEDKRIRAAKERLLEEERVKREQLEALRLQQQQELQNEKMQKEELIEKQKEQERILGEERKRLRHLEEERMKAEEAAKAAKDKLTAAEQAAKSAAEQAKEKVRQLKTSIGLKGTVGPKVDPLVSHRGKGAFTLEEFLNRATEWSGLSLDEENPKHSSAPDVDELVKASATPASNQNIPDFLKKAAAWSGLNPETYLEGTEAEGKKNSPPPKVAAKPPKPLPNAAKPDEQGSQEGEQGSQEGEQGSQEGGEGLKVEEKEAEVNVDENVGGNDGSQVVGDVSEGVTASNDASQVKEENKEEGVNEESEVDNEGSQVEVVDNEELQAVNVDKEESKVEVVDKEPEVAVVVSGGSEVAVVGVSDVVDNDEAEVKNEYVVEGGSNGNVEDSQVMQEECQGGEEGRNGSEVVDGNVQGSQVKNETSQEGVGAVVTEEKSSNAEQEEEKKCEEERKESDVVPEAANSGEAGEKNSEVGDEEAKKTGVEESQSDDTCSDVNKEESHENKEESNENKEESGANEEECGVAQTEVNPGEPDKKEPEVNNEVTKSNNNGTEMIDENSGMKEEVSHENKQEIKNSESQEPDTIVSNVDSPASQDVSEEKDIIIENGHVGQSSDDAANTNELPNNGDVKPELSEKCANPIENPTSENVEVMSS